MVFAAPCSSSASSSLAAPSASESLFAPILAVPVVRGQRGRDDDASLRLSSAPPAVQRWALVPSVGHLVHRFAYCIATKTLQQFLTCRQSEPGHCERQGFYIWQEGPVGLTQVVLNALFFVVLAISMCSGADECRQQPYPHDHRRSNKMLNYSSMSYISCPTRLECFPPCSPRPLLWWVCVCTALQQDNNVSCQRCGHATEVETLHAWVYTESGDQVDASLQNTISAMWAWRAWWLLGGGGSAPVQSGPDAPSPSTGIFAPILHRAAVKSHKDCGRLGSRTRSSLEWP
jgi:hypothetical protein